MPSKATNSKKRFCTKSGKNQFVLDRPFVSLIKHDENGSRMWKCYVNQAIHILTSLAGLFDEQSNTKTNLKFWIFFTYTLSEGNRDEFYNIFLIFPTRQWIVSQEIHCHAKLDNKLESRISTKSGKNRLTFIKAITICLSQLRGSRENEQNGIVSEISLYLNVITV